MSADAENAANQFTEKYDGKLDKTFVRGLYLAHGQMTRAGSFNRRQLDSALDSLIAGENTNHSGAATDMILLANRLASGAG